MRPDLRLLPAALAVLLVLAAVAGGVLVSRPPGDRASDVAPITLAPDRPVPPPGPVPVPVPTDGPQVRDTGAGGRMTGGARPVDPLHPAPAGSAGPVGDDADDGPAAPDDPDDSPDDDSRDDDGLDDERPDDDGANRDGDDGGGDG